MKTNALVLLALLCISKFSVANSVNCSDEFTWLKTTFESNDAGFRYAVSKKGASTYESHNASTAESVKKLKILNNVMCYCANGFHFLEAVILGFLLIHQF